MYKGCNDAVIRSNELFTQWLILPSQDRRTEGYWYLYEHDRVYRTEEKRKFYMDDVWNRQFKDPPPFFEDSTHTYYDRVCICCDHPIIKLECRKPYTCLYFPVGF